MTLTSIMTLFLAGAAPVNPTHTTSALPVIDMHLHADLADGYGPPPLGICTPFVMPVWDPAKPYAETFLKLLKQPPCKDPVWSPTEDKAVMDRTIASMKRKNVYGVLSGKPDLVAQWEAAAPGRFLSGLGYRVGRGYTLDDVKKLRAEGKLDVLAEVTNEYAGIAPDDPRMDEIWAFAEANDIPVGIHVGPGPPGSVYLSSQNMRMRLSSALTLEPVLNKYPKLRIYVMHAGYPMIDDMVAVMYMYPQVYVDTGVIIYTQRKEEFYPYLKRLIDAGFEKRIMFGSDQMVWPETIERSIARIEEAPFLSNDQKRDILYNNAARFLRLKPGTLEMEKAR